MRQPPGLRATPRTWKMNPTTPSAISSADNAGISVREVPKTRPGFLFHRAVEDRSLHALISKAGHATPPRGAVSIGTRT
jgi:hypothetical protein